MKVSIHTSCQDCKYDDIAITDNAICKDCWSPLLTSYTHWTPFDVDLVNHPSHYTQGKIEVADFIADQKLNFDRGNAVKYICRAGAKDANKEVEDLKKAIWYIEHEIKMLESKNED